jgi:hypothetical protein
METKTLRGQKALIAVTIAILLCISAAFPSLPQTESNVSKNEKIKTILARMHFADTFRLGLETGMPKFIDVYKTKNPDLTPTQVEEILKVVRTSVVDLEPSLDNMMAQVYDSQFNDEQIDALYSFYSTPVGGQIAEKQQALSAAAALQSGTWARTIWSPEITKRLQSDELLKGLEFR